MSLSSYSRLISILPFFSQKHLFFSMLRLCCVNFRPVVPAWLLKNSPYAISMRTNTIMLLYPLLRNGNYAECFVSIVHTSISRLVRFSPYRCTLPQALAREVLKTLPDILRSAPALRVRTQCHESVYWYTRRAPQTPTTKNLA